MKTQRENARAICELSIKNVRRCCPHPGPSPTLGEGNRSVSSFPKDGEITTAFCNA